MNRLSFLLIVLATAGLCALSGCAKQTTWPTRDVDTGWRVDSRVDSEVDGRLTEPEFREMPFVFYRLNDTRTNTRLAWLLITGFDLDGERGIKGPVVASQKTAMFSHPLLAVGAQGPVQLDRGCGVVEMAPPPPVPTTVDPAPIRIPPSSWGWMYIITRGLSTGAYSSQYVVSATDEPTDPNGRLQLCLAREGKVFAAPIASEYDTAWVDPDKMSYLHATWGMAILPTDDDDKSGLVDQATRFLAAVRAKYGD